MILKRWEDLPSKFQVEEIRPYYEILLKKKRSLFFKRMFDIILALFLILLFLPLFIVISILIKIDSPGSVFFRQVRITQYGEEFKIFKFRTMVQNADKLGTQVTVENDSRITRIGKCIRSCRLDELPQLLNVLNGTMSFVGTRPEVPKYVERYSPEMLATLLVPAGITSRASIMFKNEAELLSRSIDIDEKYVAEVLPAKMEYNLEDIRSFSFMHEIKLIIQTGCAMFRQ